MEAEVRKSSRGHPHLVIPAGKIEREHIIIPVCNIQEKMQGVQPELRDIKVLIDMTQIQDQPLLAI